MEAAWATPSFRVTAGGGGGGGGGARTTTTGSGVLQALRIAASGDGGQSRAAARKSQTHQ